MDGRIVEGLFQLLKSNGDLLVFILSLNKGNSFLSLPEIFVYRQHIPNLKGKIFQDELEHLGSKFRNGMIFGATSLTEWIRIDIIFLYLNHHVKIQRLRKFNWSILCHRSYPFLVNDGQPRKKCSLQFPWHDTLLILTSFSHVNILIYFLWSHSFVLFLLLCHSM